jgi:hypothetical protein
MYQKELTLRTAGGRIVCLRCNAQSKRTLMQCGAPAIRGKSKCRFHGGRSTGPLTEDGRTRCARAKTRHGFETRAIRAHKRLAVALVREYASILGVSSSIRLIACKRSNKGH